MTLYVCVCRVQQLEDENGEMKLNVCRLKSQTEKLDQASTIYQKDNWGFIQARIFFKFPTSSASFLQEKQRMTDKLEDTSLRLKDEMDLYRKIMDKLWHNRHEFQKEKEAMQEVGGDGSSLDQTSLSLSPVSPQTVSCS